MNKREFRREVKAQIRRENAEKNRRLREIEAEAKKLVAEEKKRLRELKKAQPKKSGGAHGFPPPPEEKKKIREKKDVRRYSSETAAAVTGRQPAMFGPRLRVDIRGSKPKRAEVAPSARASTARVAEKPVKVRAYTRSWPGFGPKKKKR